MHIMDMGAHPSSKTLRHQTPLAVNDVPARNLKSTQRQRLIEGMIVVANHHGYADATVSRVIAHAGVSRPTFYDYFSDRDDCFLTTSREVGQRLLAHIRQALGDAEPAQALRIAIRELLRWCETHAAEGHMLTNIMMAGGPRSLDERDQIVGGIERIVKQTRTHTSAEELSPDLQIGVAIGAVLRLLAPRMRTGGRDIASLSDELTAWIDHYNRPFCAHRWQELEPGPMPVSTPYMSDVSLHAPAPLARGRSRLSSVEVARNQRERIMHATAELAARKGYSATTIADIIGLAHIDQRVFYNHFRNKQQAFLAAHELAIQQTMAVAAGAYFSAREWPERIWQGILAGSRFQANYPTMSHMGYVEAHAVGEPAIQRVLDTQAAFTIFLLEGNQHTDVPPSRTTMDAIDLAVFEIGYRQTRAGLAHELPQLAYHAAYLTLAPYLGADAAETFVEGKLRESAGKNDEKR